MSKNYRNYFLLSVMLIFIALIVGNCGGGSDTGAVPNVSGNSAQTQNLVNKEVSGYIFWAGSIPSSEGGTTERFVVLDNPLTGEENFLTELSSYLQEETPEVWASSEVQAIYSQLSSEMAGWKPLKEWNGNANLYTIYQDSKQTSPLQVDTNGHFSGTVLVSSADDNVRFEVIVGDNEKCYSVEAISSTEISTSESNATGLISCPQIILNFPGWCTIFAVRSLPDAINLKEAGLTFTLNDTDPGCVSPPIYLQCGGTRNYEVAFGIFYANPGISTPASTTITAQTTTGLSLNIFTEVIGICASIEGHVGGTGVTPFAGFVYSAGWNAFDCIDEAGNYKLNAVFKGHFREVVAVYWVQVNGQLVKYREERTIDFFNGNLTGFDLPEGVQPTPTVRHPMDSFYKERVSEVMTQFDQWEVELGREAAVQQTVNWLNDGLPEGPPIPEEIVEAIVDEYEVTRFWIRFADGLSWCIGGKTYAPIYLDNFGSQTSSSMVANSVAGTTDSGDILVLAPSQWEDSSLIRNNGWPFELFNYMVYAGMAADLDHKGYEVKQVLTEETELLPDEVSSGVVREPTVDEPGIYKIVWTVSSSEANIVRPSDYQDLGKYGIIYIATHSDGHGLISNVLCNRDSPNIWNRDLQTETWLDDHKAAECKYWPPDDKGDWSIETWESPEVLLDIEPPGLYKVRYDVLMLSKNFFRNQNYNNSIIYIDACSSWELRDAFMGSASKPKVYLGHTIPSYTMWSRLVAYQFFTQMMYGYSEFPVEPIPRVDEDPPILLPEIIPTPPPVSVRGSHNKLIADGLNIDDYLYEGGLEPCTNCELQIDTQGGLYDDTYFPATVNITVQED